ncbi:MAG: restriction endonuclease subunit S [Zunongwangia sp.]|uniref:Restriction modification system DNA specificity subunit n=2 Tax=Zunongwangia profunda TaxID=398743 RepID=D5BEI8_ZUNPS|nr:restriction endonuclease subunit S [Zunongwangia profunda]ADF54973.1 restriction modification system DNA specificity subunit [Zunongwangia profunda SM-A87]MAO38120.1 restriction endonuclease subunit S [Zunongwangia sp.]HAJ81199.1 restriction endonuclease subunit S [Zunongwangia profunda]HCV80065.1 restriction endonuclease subunit S [Zunongwangia profunda]|tara:strand:+ start:1788 stop:3005 length:1218 start_codon:yes stop_codon:yes gene_type:complete
MLNSLNRIPENWEVVDFRNVAELKHGYQFRNYDFTDKGIKIFKITQIKGDGIADISSCSYIDINRIDEFKRVILNKGDILIALTGATIGKVARFNFDEIVLQNYRVGNFIPLNENILNKEYFFQFLKSDFFFNQILANQTQSAQQNIGKEDINNMSVVLPPLPEQKAIANILSAIDAKIENNLAINKTLEEMAMALYKEWFVDFGPFQDGKFIESELGLIPEGWVVANLEDLFVLQRGFDLPKKKRIEGNVPIYAASGKSTYHNEYKVEAPGVTTGRSGVLGNVYFVSEDFWPLNTSLWIKEYRSSTPYHAFFVLKNIDLKEFNSGSAVPTLNRNDVHRIKVVKPEKSIINLFSVQIAKIFRKIEMNTQQKQTLTQLRDTLLPKLVSGEVRLNEFDLEEVLEGEI